MDEVTRNLTSISWWIGVAFVSVVLNLISAYLKAGTDTVFVKLSKRWSARTQALSRAREVRVRQIRESDRELQLMLAGEICDRIRAAQATLLSLLLLVLYVFVLVRVPSTVAINSDLFLSVVLKFFYWGSLILLLIGMRSMLHAMTKRATIEDAISLQLDDQSEPKRGPNGIS